MRALVLCGEEEESGKIARMLGGAMSVDSATTPKEALALTRRRKYSLYIIDIEAGGIELCRTIRRFSKAAIIFISPERNEAKAVAGFDAGADDYLPRPYGMLELASRVRAVMRRCSDTPCRIEWLDEATRSVLIDGEPVALSPTEYDILMVLARAGGSAVSKRDIIRAAWGDCSFATDDALKVRVKALRDKIGAGRVETVRGFGYRLVT